MIEHTRKTPTITSAKPAIRRMFSLRDNDSALAASPRLLADLLLLAFAIYLLFSFRSINYCFGLVFQALAVLLIGKCHVTHRGRVVP